MKQQLTLISLVLLAALMVACGGQKKTDQIIVAKYEKPAPQGPIRSEDYTEQKNIQWLGKTYQLEIQRVASDSLPMVSDETGQQYVDNRIMLKISRSDGSVFMTKAFTKHSFDSFLDEDYRKTGILEGFVFDRVEGNELRFAASVSHPQTDEYIPLVVAITRMGDIAIVRDTQMDTNGGESMEEEEDSGDDGV